MTEVEREAIDLVRALSGNARAELYTDMIGKGYIAIVCGSEEDDFLVTITPEGRAELKKQNTQ